MGLEIVTKDGRHCPTFICDHCLLEITNARQGNYEWDEEGGAALFLHKNCCYSSDRSRGRLDFNMGLDVFVAYLLNNSGLNTPRQIRQAQEVAAMFSRL